MYFWFLTKQFHFTRLLSLVWRERIPQRPILPSYLHILNVPKTTESIDRPGCLPRTIQRESAARERVSEWEVWCMCRYFSLMCLKFRWEESLSRLSFVERKSSFLVRFQTIGPTTLLTSLNWFYQHFLLYDILTVSKESVPLSLVPSFSREISSQSLAMAFWIFVLILGVKATVFIHLCIRA